jgi:hypothetical protein
MADNVNTNQGDGGRERPEAAALAQAGDKMSGEKPSAAVNERIDQLGLQSMNYVQLDQFCSNHLSDGNKFETMVQQGRVDDIPLKDLQSHVLNGEALATFLAKDSSAKTAQCMAATTMDKQDVARRN